MSDKTTFKKIRTVLEFVWKNPYSSFYRDKYKKAGIDLLKDINSLEDFKKLPYLTKEEIVNSDPFERFFLPWNKFGAVSISSGTTSSSDSVSIVFRGYGHGDFYKRALTGKSNKSLASVMRLFPPVQATKSLIESFIVTQKKGEKVINVLGDINNLPLSAKIVARLKIDKLTTSPTILYFFLPYLKKEYDLKKIKRLVLIGEYCTRQKALIFKKSFKNSLINYNYGVSEAQGGAIGINCKYLDSLLTNYFHSAPDYFCETTEDCELIVTDLGKNGFPLIRYKTGDGVQMEDFKCKCGASKRMRILGRINYDSVRIHGTFIYANLIEKTLLPFKKYLGSPLWQLHVYEVIRGEKILPKLKLQLVGSEILKQVQAYGSERPQARRDDKRESIKKMIEEGVSQKLYLSPRKTLTDLVRESIFLPLEVEFVQEFQVKGKHRYIISHIE